MRRPRLRLLWDRFSVWFFGPYVEPPHFDVGRLIDQAEGAAPESKASVDEWGHGG